MALVAKFLVDTSAGARLQYRDVADRLLPLIAGGLVGTCATLDFEALHSARSLGEYEDVRTDRIFAYEYLPTNDRDWARVLHLQRELARQGRHRSVGMPDLLVAAVAEREQLTVLHYDRDFDLVAEITGQPMEWVVPAGTV